MSRLHRFHLLAAEQVQKSPSRADGVPESMEHRRRKLAAQHMRDISYLFKMGITTWAIAVTFFNRFYARKSMKKNNTFIVACASLFLAGKVNDEARSHEKLANELIKAWFGKDNPQLLAIQAEYRALAGRTVAQQRRAAGTPPTAGGGDTPQSRSPAPCLPAFYTGMYEAVLEAERALLYTVGFDFNVEIIHTWLARLLNRPRFKAMGLKENKLFQQHLVGIANDVYHKDGTLVLQYPTEKVALAAFYLVFKAAKTHGIKEIPLPEPAADGRPWFVEEGLSQAECVEITTRFADRLYSDNKGGAAGQRKAGGGAPSAQPAPSGAASTAMLGACESAAYSGAPTVGTMGGIGGGGGGGGGGTGGRSDLLSDAAGEHTSVPRPLGSDRHAGASGGGSKRPADGPPGGTPGSTPRPHPGAGAAGAAAAAVAGQGQGQGQQYPAKRARVEQMAAGSNEATSSAMHPSPLGGTSQHSPACNGTAASALAAAAKAAPAVLAAAAAPAEDSEKEEGELEEGELA